MHIANELVTSLQTSINNMLVNNIDKRLANKAWKIVYKQLEQLGKNSFTQLATLNSVIAPSKINYLILDFTKISVIAPSKTNYFIPDFTKIWYYPNHILYIPIFVKLQNHTLIIKIKFYRQFTKLSFPVS